MLDHEYTMLGGVNRAKVGRYLSIISAAVSAGMVFVLLWAVNFAGKYGLPAQLPPYVLSLFGAGAVFTVLYWILNHYAWRWIIISRMLKVPNLAGEWSCKGNTLKTETTQAHSWDATVTIVQNWDRIRVRLKTEHSGSNSTSAALIRDESDGFHLFYSYKNDPKIGEIELRSHRGFAEILFARNLKTGEGEYFNGHGRYTFGTMRLERIS